MRQGIPGSLGAPVNSQAPIHRGCIVSLEQKPYSSLLQLAPPSQRSDNGHAPPSLSLSFPCYFTKVVQQARSQAGWQTTPHLGRDFITSQAQAQLLTQQARSMEIRGPGMLRGIATVDNSSADTEGEAANTPHACPQGSYLLPLPCEAWPHFELV